MKVAFVLSLATLFATAYGQAPNQAGPGTLNYVEGHVALGGRPVTQQAIGSAAMTPDQTLSTSDGRAEVLLTPGVFLRLAHDTTVKLVSPNLTNTEFAVLSGKADLEVDALYPQNNLLIDDGKAQAKILKTGLYSFIANPGILEVFDGKAAVSPSDNAAWINVRGGHQLALNGDRVKPASFNKDAAKDDLYNWSSLRADYIGQANANLLAQGYAGPGGWDWYPSLYGYTWLPYDGFFYSPFGYGFYSPAFFYGGGFGYYGGFRGGYGGGGFHGGGRR